MFYIYYIIDFEVVFYHSISIEEDDCFFQFLPHNIIRFDIEIA